MWRLGYKFCPPVHPWMPMVRSDVSMVIDTKAKTAGTCYMLVPVTKVPNLTLYPQKNNVRMSSEIVYRALRCENMSGQ